MHLNAVIDQLAVVEPGRVVEVCGAHITNILKYKPVSFNNTHTDMSKIEPVRITFTGKM